VLAVAVNRNGVEVAAIVDGLSAGIVERWCRSHRVTLLPPTPKTAGQPHRIDTQRAQDTRRREHRPIMVTPSGPLAARWPKTFSAM